MQLEHRSHPSSAPMLRVGVSSADPELIAGISRAYEVENVSIRLALTAPEQLKIDVLVVDARHHQQLVPTARLATEGTFGIVVVARQQDAVEAMKYLDIGALDVIWNGASEQEVNARIRSAARYADSVEDDWILVDELAISLKRHEVRRSGSSIRLTPTEFRLLEALVASPGQTVSHRDLLYRVWGTSDDSGRHQLRVYVRQVREKLEPDPANPRFLLTAPGVGYRFAQESTSGKRAAG